MMWFVFPGDRLRLKIQVGGCGYEVLWACGFDLSGAFNPGVFQNNQINNVIVNVNIIPN